MSHRRDCVELERMPLITFYSKFLKTKMNALASSFLYAVLGIFPSSQGVTKRCRLSLLTNSAVVILVQMRGEGGVAGSQAMSTAVQITWHRAQINFGDLPPYLTQKLWTFLTKRTAHSDIIIWSGTGTCFIYQLSSSCYPVAAYEAVQMNFTKRGCVIIYCMGVLKNNGNLGKQWNVEQKGEKMAWS